MPSNRPNVCVPCRWITRQGGICAHCGQPLVMQYYTWRAPRKTNDRAWKRIEAGDWLWDHTVLKPAPSWWSIRYIRGRMVRGDIRVKPRVKS